MKLTKKVYGDKNGYLIRRKYRMTETYVDDQWGFEQVWHNWCKLYKRNMELKFGKGNDKYFHKEDCQYWESNKN